jgi:hypothetical protein
MATPEKFDYGLHTEVYVDAKNYSDIDHDVEVSLHSLWQPE